MPNDHISEANAKTYKKDIDKEKQMLLSVIVPVYNVENYIEKCIQSICEQQYCELEIILVDDGSTDASGYLCDAAAEKDERIRVYHTANQGAASARKLGVRSAQGEFIAFVDSDDYIEPEMYREMMKFVLGDDAELVSSGLRYEWQNKSQMMMDSIEEGIYERDRIGQEILPRLIYNQEKDAQGITASVSNKIFKKELLERFVYEIDEKIVLGEDGALIYACAVLAEKIVILHKCWYHYVQHGGSVMRSASLESFEALYALKDFFYQFFRQYDFFPVLEPQIKHYVGAFLNDVVRSVYHIGLCQIYSMFPYELIPKGSRIVIYGAGRVGISYWTCIQNGNYAAVAAWVDGNYQNVSLPYAVLEAPESIMEKEYDYVVIAVAEEAARDAIYERLRTMGVREEQIVWKISPINVYS